MIVLDSSAVIALMLQEAGSDAVEAVLDNSAISTANVAEVYSKASELGMPSRVCDAVFALKGIAIVPLSFFQAQMVGALRGPTRAAGLSLGDRCCLALAREIVAPALTADRQWVGIAESVGIEVRLIR